jgi:hypothetical protein
MPTTISATEAPYGLAPGDNTIHFAIPSGAYASGKWVRRVSLDNRTGSTVVGSDSIATGSPTAHVRSLGDWSIPPLSADTVDADRAATPAQIADVNAAAGATLTATHTVTGAVASFTTVDEMKLVLYTEEVMDPGFGLTDPPAGGFDPSGGGDGGFGVIDPSVTGYASGGDPCPECGFGEAAVPEDGF